MEKKGPIPEDMIPCLGTYFQSKEFDDDLNALFDEVQQIEHMTKQDKAANIDTVPVYDIASVITFFKHAIEDTDECKDIISKITDEQIEKSVYKELENIRGENKGNIKLMNKKEIVEIFKKMIMNEFDYINKEFYPNKVIVPPIPAKPEIVKQAPFESKKEESVLPEVNPAKPINLQEISKEEEKKPIVSNEESLSKKIPDKAQELQGSSSEQSKELIPSKVEIEIKVQGEAKKIDESEQIKVNPSNEVKKEILGNVVEEIKKIEEIKKAEISLPGEKEIKAELPQEEKKEGLIPKDTDEKSKQQSSMEQKTDDSHPTEIKKAEEKLAIKEEKANLEEVSKEKPKEPQQEIIKEPVKIQENVKEEIKVAVPINIQEEVAKSADQEIKKEVTNP